MSITAKAGDTSMFVKCLNKIDMSLARLTAWCVCFIIATHSCHHKSTGMHNIMMEHGVGTHHFILFHCSEFDLVSFSLGFTAVLGTHKHERDNLPSFVLPWNMQSVLWLC